MNIFEILSNLFGLKKSDGNGFDLSSLLPLLTDGEGLADIISLISKIRNGEIEISTVISQLLPALLPIFLQQNTAQDDNLQSYADNSFGISVIEDIADSNILCAISNYFDDTAS